MNKFLSIRRRFSHFKVNLFRFPATLVIAFPRVVTNLAAKLFCSAEWHTRLGASGSREKLTSSRDEISKKKWNGKNERKRGTNGAAKFSGWVPREFTESRMQRAHAKDGKYAYRKAKCWWRCWLKRKNKNVNICMTSGLYRGKVAEMKLSSTKVKNVIFELPRRKYTKIRI